MRIIKFRAWDINEQKMRYVYDSYVGDFDGFWKWHSKHASKLMQFTGIKDKNGIDIYEGDIILTNQIVTWNDEIHDRGDNELFCWGIQNGKYNLYDYRDYDDFIVIGNIYENPKLIKRKMK